MKVLNIDDIQENMIVTIYNYNSTGSPYIVKHVDLPYAVIKSLIGYPLTFSVDLRVIKLAQTTKEYVESFSS